MNCAVVLNSRPRVSFPLALNNQPSLLALFPVAMLLTEWSVATNIVLCCHCNHGIYLGVISYTAVPLFSPKRLLFPCFVFVSYLSMSLITAIHNTGLQWFLWQQLNSESCAVVSDINSFLFLLMPNWRITSAKAPIFLIQ